MKLQDCRNAEADYSHRAGELARNLAFAGLAIVWICRTETIEGPTLSKGLVGVTALIVVGLALDLLHYVIAATYWDHVVRRKEAELIVDAGTPSAHFDEQREFAGPQWLDRFLHRMFYAKIGFIAAAYLAILIYLLSVKMFR